MKIEELTKLAQSFAEALAPDNDEEIELRLKNLTDYLSNNNVSCEDFNDSVFISSINRTDSLHTLRNTTFFNDKIRLINAETDFTKKQGLILDLTSLYNNLDQKKKEIALPLILSNQEAAYRVIKSQEGKKKEDFIEKFLKESDQKDKLKDEIISEIAKCSDDFLINLFSSLYSYQDLAKLVLEKMDPNSNLHLICSDPKHAISQIKSETKVKFEMISFYMQNKNHEVTEEIASEIINLSFEFLTKILTPKTLGALQPQNIIKILNKTNFPCEYKYSESYEKLLNSLKDYAFNLEPENFLKILATLSNLKKSNEEPIFLSSYDWIKNYTKNIKTEANKEILAQYLAETENFGNKNHHIDYYKLQLGVQYLQNNKEISTEDFINKVLNFISKDGDRKEIISLFFQNSREINKKITIDDFLKILDLMREDKRGEIISAFLKNSEISSNSLVRILNIPIENPYKIEIIKKIPAEVFIKIFEAEIPLNQKEFIIETYLTNLEKDEIKKIPAEIFAKTLGAAKNLDQYQKKSLIKTYLKDLEESKRLDSFTKIILEPSIQANGLSMKFQSNLIVDFYNDVFGQTQNLNHLDQLTQIVKALHLNSENLQIDILEEAIMKNLVTREHILNNQAFTGYINGLKNDDLTLYLITKLQEKRIIENTETKILDLVKGRIATRFEFIKELINGQSLREDEGATKPLSEFLTEEGFESLKGLFKEEYLKKNNITILDIVSYYDIQNHLLTLSKMLKPEFKEQLKQNIKGSKDILLSKPEEMIKLSQLTGQSEDVIKEKFIQNQVLGDYFAKKIPQITDLSQEEKDNYKVDFTDSDFDQSRQNEINQGFRELLSKPDQNKRAEDFVGLFTLIATGSKDVNDPTITNNRTKLKDFFRKSEKELLFALKQNGGIGVFTSLKPTLVDGCSANIGTQFNMALIAAILKEPQDQILYQILTEKIIPEILNRDGGDVIGTNSNPLTNHTVKNYHLSPEGLFEEVCKVFIGEQKIASKQKEKGKDSYQFIEEFLIQKLGFSQEFAESIKAKLGEDLKYDNIKVREVAAYLILKHTIGEENALKAGKRAAEARKNLGTTIFNARNPEPDDKKIRTFEDVDLRKPKPEEEPSKSPKPETGKAKKAKDDFGIGIKK